MKTRIITMLIIFICVTAKVNSQTLFVENFHYPQLDSLETTVGWTLGGVNSPYNVKVSSPGLSYAGYLSSGLGNTASMQVHDDGDICQHTFNKVTSGSIYMSFMMRVDSLSANSTSGSNICFDEYSGATNINTKVYIKRLTSSTFSFGIAKYQFPKYASGVYSTNVTYLVVVKYTFVSGASNDSSKIYVFNSGIPSVEPSTPAALDVQGLDVANIGDVALTNCYAAGGLQGSSVKFDGIRIGTTWNYTLFTNFNYQLRLKALMEGFYNPVTGKLKRDTARVYLRHGFSPYPIVESSKAFLDSTGYANFTFSNAVNGNNYYFVFRHRNSIETWSFSAYPFINNIRDYDFAASDLSAYGYNLIKKGQKYCMYGGDVDQDGTVDLTDITLGFNDAKQFSTGYLPTDVNGDNFVDMSDIVLMSNNAKNFVAKITP